MLDIDWYIDIRRSRDELFVRGIRNGKEVYKKIPYTPTLFVEHHNDYGFKNIYGNNLKPISFETMSEADAFAHQHKESNLSIHGNPFYSSQFAFENFPDNATKWEKEHLRVFNIDIEVTSTEGFPRPDDAAYPITAICIHDSIADKFVTFGYKEEDNWTKEDSQLPQELLDKVVYIKCESEFTLINKFIQYWSTFPPHIVTGWNIEGFDMPYIFNRLNNLGIKPQKLSPWNQASKREVTMARGTEERVNLFGVAIVDYLDRYKRNKVQDSYRLDNIASIELNEAKLDYSEVTGLHNLYFENFQKFIDYNIQDVNLVKRLDEKLGLIDAQVMVAFTSCLNLDEVNGTVRTWDALISNEMWQENKVIPYHLTVQSQGGGIPGGHVKTPQVGKHGWCVSFDLNSLYPHLIMQYNISPETIVDNYRLWPHDSIEARIQKLLDKEQLPASVPANCSISAAGYAYRNDFTGIIPRIMKRLYQQRKAVKKEMLRKQAAGEEYSIEFLRQFVIKILLNSGYGALVNKYNRWYDKKLGESITCSGQYAIQVSERAINDWMNKVLNTNKDYIIAIDTDSNYVDVQPLVDKFFSDKSKDEIVDILDKICEEQIQKSINAGYEEAAKYLNCHEQAMVMEREAIASSAVWTAKKRYAMCVWDMEGVRFNDKPKIKIQGLEAIRSSTPAVCRETLLNAIEMILREDEITVQNFIASFKKDFMNFEIEDISFPRSINNLKKYTQQTGYMKGTPPHVRGAILYNRLLEYHNLQKVYEEAKSGEKAKFVYLHEPNNVGTDVISFPNVLPKEFDVEKYVNKEKMFEKIVVDPLTGILEPIGWSVEKRNTLLDFFG